MNKQQPLSKLTKAYLSKFFKSQNLPYEEWSITIDGQTHTIDNHSVIDSILQADSGLQRVIVDALDQVSSSNQDVNVFLKHLAFENHSFGSTTSH